MAGGPAHILPGAVASIGPWSASKIQMKILCSLPKYTSRIRPQNPHQNRLFAPKTQQAVWVRPLQTKIMCKLLPEMDGTNSGSSALEAVKAVGEIVAEGKSRVVFEEVVLFLRRLLVDFKLIKEEIEKMQRRLESLDNAESELNTVEGSEDIRDQVSFEIRDLIDDLDTSSETIQRMRLDVVRCVQRFFMSQQLMIRCVQRFSSLQRMTRCVQRFFMRLQRMTRCVQRFFMRLQRMTRYVQRFFSQQLMTRFWINFRILVIKLKILDMFKKKGSYGLLREINESEINEKRRRPALRSKVLQDHRRSSAEEEEPEVEEPEVVFGLHEEIRTVRERLINGKQSRCVISIVGMGGSGKTTLAKKVFRDVKDAFECHALICLSQQYESKDVIMRMIEAVMGLSREAIEKLNEEKLRDMLCDHLRKKKYLVVIDDIWSRKAWKLLQSVLPDGKDKSRVMLTTRNKDVALYADRSSPPVEMPFLVGDEGWELFKKTIFSTEKNPSIACPSELEDTGKKILAKCRGLPLVIIAIGGLLAIKDKTLNVWSKVLYSVDRRLTKGLDLDSVDVHSTEGPEWCMEILALSYWDLPYYLKPCFLYFGLFPEDYEIDSAKLIRLWIAEGFIQQRIHEIIEDDAEEYLEELIQRSMIQVSWKQHDGSVGGCRIHDLFRKIAILKAQKNNFFTIHNVEGTHSLPNNIRRLALHRSVNGYHPTSTLRSILDFCGTIDISDSEFKQAKFLRVMCQDRLHPRKAASMKELKEFVHLRYLELVEMSQSLPSSSLGDLGCLQTLVLRRFDGSLSNAISNLKQLRHLDSPYSEVGNLRVKDLTNLQTLSVASGNWIKDGFGNLTNLRHLTILAGPGLNDKTLSDSIEKLCSLRSLILDGELHLPQLMPFTKHVHLYEMSLYGRMEKLPELPPYLRELFLCDSCLEQDDISKLEKLPYLKILHLSRQSYKSKKMICSSGRFPRLEILVMTRIPLEEWEIEEGAMPSLKGVALFFVPYLKTHTLPPRVRVLLKQI